MSNDSIMNTTLIDMKFICEHLGMTDKWIYKLIQNGRFPKPIKLGRSSKWKLSEVDQWLQDQIIASRGS